MCYIHIPLSLKGLDSKLSTKWDYGIAKHICNYFNPL